jgi:hypothetical protein
MYVPCPLTPIRKLLFVEIGMRTAASVLGHSCRHRSNIIIEGENYAITCRKTVGLKN